MNHKFLAVTISLVGLVLSLHADTHYVSQSGSHTAPYTNWVTAATNIQDAVDAAVAGDMVLVTNGTYVLSSEISVSDAITVQSANGPDHTIVDGGGTVRCFNLADTACVLSGFTITNGLATGPHPADYGGGIYCLDLTPVITNCIITGNTATSGGGVFYGTVISSVIRDNEALVYGGGMFGSEASSCFLELNTAGGGGGMRAGTVRNCTIVSNTATTGGGLYDCTANNCEITRNIALQDGGGMHVALANNCTISGNSSLMNGGGMNGGEATNSIIWHNLAGSGGENLNGTAIQYSSSPDAVHGSNGNITNAPAFVDKNSGNYRLRWISTCVNAGTNDGVVGSTDLGGTNRILYGTVDMGAYETVDSDSDQLSDAEEEYLGTDPLDADSDDDGLNDGEEIQTYGTDPLDEDSDSDGLEDGEEVNTYGTEPLVDADFDGDSLSDSDEVNIHSTDPLDADTDNDDLNDGYEVRNGGDPLVPDATPIHHVSPSGSQTYPYQTWGTAATNIQEAVNAASSNDTVLVADGIYQLVAEVLVDRDIIIKSVNGPAFTVVDGAGSVRCFNLADKACILSGFTITNGLASGVYPANSGGGVYCETLAPVATNCTISGNTAASGGGMSFGVAYNCAITGNTATLYGGGKYLGVANNCTLAGNVASIQGGGMYDGTANNCTIVCNVATNGGGGMRFGTARNSIVWYNSVPLGSNHDLLSTATLYTCSPDAGYGSNGSITNAPAFVDISNANYRLRGISPCIDIGINVYVAGPFDLDGGTRILKGTVDMGAYEALDSDSDGLTDAEEPVFGGTDPFDPDSDNDGLLDGAEVNTHGTDPLLFSTDGDGIGDGDEITNNMSPFYNHDAFLDNYVHTNAASLGYYTESQVLDLAVGDIGVEITNGMAEISVQLWQSDDLITWTNLGGTVYFAEPVDADKKFFRIRAEP